MKSLMFNYNFYLETFGLLLQSILIYPADRSLSVDQKGRPSSYYEIYFVYFYYFVLFMFLKYFCCRIVHRHTSNHSVIINVQLSCENKQ